MPYHNPFGEADCREEVALLKGDYSGLYFNEAPFNDAALDRNTYLIIGRRGAGKTALSQYFSFQDRIKDPIYISSSDPKTYSQILSRISSHASQSRELAIPALKQVWEYIIWQLLWEHIRPLAPVSVRGPHDLSRKDASGFIRKLLQKVHDVLIEETSGDSLAIQEQIDVFLNKEEIRSAQQEAVKLSRTRPIIVVIDTLERYDKDDEGNLNAVAALVQFAGEFQTDFHDSNIHLKVLVSGEIFPHLEEEIIQNPLKSIKDPVFLFWRPRDLLRLICWRLYRFLKANDRLRPESKGPLNWNSYKDVLHKVWLPYFGDTIINARGSKEHTFSYVLRHTQMRPRQLIILCNSIAALSVSEGRFPLMSERAIRSGIKAVETRLATEVISSFSLIYPNVPRIIDAGLQNMSVVFQGNELDIRARESASEWPKGTYSPGAFKRLVAELGIIGKVRSQNQSVLDAEFEYSVPGRIVLTHRDQCVIHPMYYARLNTVFNVTQYVVPFRGEDGETHQ